MISPSIFVHRQEQFLLLEREAGLFDARYRQVAPWRLMRNHVHRSLFGFSVSNITVPKSRRIIGALDSSGRLLCYGCVGKERDLLVKTSVAGLRNETPEGFWTDQYFDDVLPSWPNYFKLQDYNSPYFEEQRRNARFPSHLDPSAFSFWGRIFGKLKPARLNGFDERVAQLFDKNFGLKLSVSELNMRVSSVFWQARLYGLLLSRIRPKVVCVSDTGEFGLMLAAKRLGIPFVELQHGVFDNLHPDAVPDHALGNGSELLLPDCYATFGKYWIERIAGTRQHQGHCAIVGNSQTERVRNGTALKSSDRPVCHIFVTSQGVEKEAMADWLEKLIALAPAGQEWTMTIKLHPVFDREVGALHLLEAHPGVRILQASEEPSTPALLKACSVHLSISSACHFDAAALGKLTMVLPLPHYEYMLGAIDSKSIFLAQKPEDVWTRLKGKNEWDLSLAEHYCQSGFATNLKALLFSLVAARPSQKA
jgi:hypothetical protein